MEKTIGVLALQGAFARHLEALRRIGALGREVRECADLEGLDGLIIPGGESTTISKMLQRWSLTEPLADLVNQGFPVFGTCAGLILLSDHVENWQDLPRPRGLDITVVRNAYGRQIDSFEATLDMSRVDGIDTPFQGVFIRAPLIERVGDGVEVLCEFEGVPVLVRRGNILGGSFHPELAGDDRLHRWFLDEIVGRSNLAKQAG